MKITKFVHSCLLVETSDRVALFDPGSMSEQALGAVELQRLDDIFITHVHGDHCHPPLIKQLLSKFPTVRITGTDEIVKSLAQEGIKATSTPPADVNFFDAPHESVAPMFPEPEEFGYHYLGALSHPGDSHSFHETKAILALPVQAPWGSTVRAINLALELKPQHILPIHDWHWRDEARESMYARLEQVFSEQSITFHKLKNGVPVEIDIAADASA
ncbi:MAG TPA: MBL fold metallo-hydrolase [Candidatus Saccharimonadales bacterium]|nr:MBL fold metallo-hydrolase [Candidatus Saccharimonadales bacterium]